MSYKLGLVLFDFKCNTLTLLYNKVYFSTKNKEFKLKIISIVFKCSSISLHVLTRLRHPITPARTQHTVQILTRLCYAI